jgi:DNA-binding transcriptional ArsR family regulator
VTDKKLAALEKRIIALEKKAESSSKKTVTKPKLDSLTTDLDSIMQGHGSRFTKGVFFSGLAIPSENPNRLVRWSCSGGFKTKNEFDSFLNMASGDDISRFCSNFSSPEKMKIIRILIQEEPLTQKEILELTDLSQGQFYHHVKELIANKLIQKMKQDKYDLSPMGHVLAVSFIGIINTFLK